MAAKSPGFLKIRLSALVLALALLGASALPAGQPFVIRDVTKGSDLDLLPAASWPPPESEHGGMVIKLSYLRGVIDALQMVEVAPRTSAQVLKKLKGKDLNTLAAAIDRYYLADPRRRELAPASVLFRILPTQIDKPEVAPIPRQK